MVSRGKTSGVADLGCLSQIPDPDFYPSRIPDLRSNNIVTKEEGKKCALPFFVATNMAKLKIIFFFKILLSSQKYEVMIRDSEETYFGSRIQESKKCIRSATLGELSQPDALDMLMFL
jgi:hypothetical protein